MEFGNFIKKLERLILGVQDIAWRQQRMLVAPTFNCCFIITFLMRQLLHNSHQILRHEVRLIRSIVLLAVFAEAEKDGIDSHLENSHETVDDQKCK